MLLLQYLKITNMLLMMCVCVCVCKCSANCFGQRMLSTMLTSAHLSALILSASKKTINPDRKLHFPCRKFWHLCWFMLFLSFFFFCSACALGIPVGSQMLWRLFIFSFRSNIFSLLPNSDCQLSTRFDTLWAFTEIYNGSCHFVPYVTPLFLHTTITSSKSHTTTKYATIW